MTSDLPPSTTAKDRLTWVDTGRGIAILLVVLYHSTQWLTGFGFDTHVLKWINGVISSLRMPLFFVLSGLFARKWLTVSWGDLFRSKIRLYIWVFFLWETIGTVITLIGWSVHGEAINVRGALLALIVSPVFPRFELWFIWALILYFVAAKATRTVAPWLQLAVAGLVASVALTIWLTSSETWTGGPKYYFFFLAGIYLRGRVLALGTTSQTFALVGAFTAWAAVSFGFALLEVRDVYPLYFINCLFGVAGGIALSRALSRVPVLRRIGTQTLPIYLAHTPIIISICALLSLGSLGTFLHPAGPVLPLLLAPSAVTLALLLHRSAQRNALQYLYHPPVEIFERALRTKKR